MTSLSAEDPVPVNSYSPVKPAEPYHS